MSSLLSYISLLLHRKRKLFTLSKFSLSLKANDTLFSNKLLKAALCTISLLFENEASELAVSYRIIKLVMPLLATSGVTLYFCDKDITDFLKTWDNFIEDWECIK